jgi:hypothetical protein
MWLGYLSILTLFKFKFMLFTLFFMFMNEIFIALSFMK